MSDEGDIKRNISQSPGKRTKGSVETEIISATPTTSPP